MEEAQNKSGGYTSHLSFLEILSKHALSFIGLSYIFGFIIVNSYLASFGLVSIGIVKAKYIAAGVVFLVFISLCVLILYPLAFYTLKEKKEFKTGDILYSIGSLVLIEQLLLYIAPDSLNFFSHDRPFSNILLIIAGISLVFAIFCRFVKKLSKFTGLLYFLGMGIFAYLMFELGVIFVLFFVVCLVFLGSVFISNLMDVLARKKPFTGLMAMGLIYVVSVTLGLCQIYTRYLYPKIENKYGGGKPVDVILFLGKEMELSSELLFEGKQESSQTIKDVSLIDEDGDYFFIQKKGLQQNKTIRIKKSLVNVIIHGNK